MANPNILTKQQYEKERVYRLGACALDEAALYDANFIDDASNDRAYAFRRIVQVLQIVERGKVFEVTLKPHPMGAVRIEQMTLNGSLFQPEMDPSKTENGYLVDHKLDHMDDVLNEMITEYGFVPVPRNVRQPEEPRHLPALSP